MCINTLDENIVVTKSHVLDIIMYFDVHIKRKQINYFRNESLVIERMHIHVYPTNLMLNSGGVNSTTLICKAPKPNCSPFLPTTKNS